MFKKLILILLLTKIHFQQEDHEEDPDLLKGIELVKKYFEHLKKDELTRDEAANALVLVFDEIDYDQLHELDDKEELTPEEEEIKSFKGYLKRYFDQKHLDEKLDFQLMVDILKKNYLLEFLQLEMEREEKDVFNQQYDLEDNLDFASLDDLQTIEDEGNLIEEEFKEDL